MLYSFFSILICTFIMTAVIWWTDNIICQHISYSDTNVLTSFKPILSAYSLSSSKQFSLIIMHEYASFMKSD